MYAECTKVREIDPIIAPPHTHTHISLVLRVWAADTEISRAQLSLWGAGPVLTSKLPKLSIILWFREVIAVFTVGDSQYLEVGGPVWGLEAHRSTNKHTTGTENVDGNSGQGKVHASLVMLTGENHKADSFPS